MSRLRFIDVQVDCDSVGLHLTRANAIDRREALARNEPVPRYVATHWTSSPQRFRHLCEAYDAMLMQRQCLG